MVPIRIGISATHLFGQVSSRSLEISLSSWLETRQISRHGKPHVRVNNTSSLYIPWVSEGCCLLYLNELGRIVLFEQQTAYVHDCLDYLDTNHVEKEHVQYSLDVPTL